MPAGRSAEPRVAGDAAAARSGSTRGSGRAAPRRPIAGRAARRRAPVEGSRRAPEMSDVTTSGDSSRRAAPEREAPPAGWRNQLDGGENQDHREGDPGDHAPRPERVAANA